MINNMKLGLNNLVTQSNRLVESRYNLNITEQRLVLAMISMIDPEDEDFREYTIKIANLSKILGLKDKNIYSTIKQITRSIMGKVIQIKTEKGILQINWISSASYDDNSGQVILKFDPSLKPFLLNIRENYTSTKFGIVAKFNSFYTSRIYMLIKQYQKIGERTISIDYLGELFPQYKLYKNLKRRIIIPAQKEICSISDITFSFREVKIGRKVKEIIFFNIKNQSFSSELPLFSTSKTIEENIPEIMHRKYGVDINVANRLVEKAEDKDFVRIFTYIDKAIANDKVKNLPGFVVKCIEDQYYQHETIVSKKEDILDVKKEIKFDNKNKFWKKVKESLQIELGEEVFHKWISHLNYINKDGGVMKLVTEGELAKFYRDMIKREYIEVIKDTARSIDGKIQDVIISIIE